MTQAVALLLSLALGLLIGLERGWRHRDEHDGGRIAGIRTFGLLGLGGGLAGVASASISVWISVVVIAGVAAALLLAHRARLREDDDNVSATNAIVGILTAVLGLMATTGLAREAMISAGAITLILSMRNQLHGWLQTLEEKDIRAVAQYGAITLVALPLLPDRAMGPYEALNPRMLWLIVVFVTGVSFAGYWAAKRFGNARGTIIASALGATYSSTAVTLELARRLRDDAADRPTLNAGIAAATTMMPLRTLLLCAVLAPSALGDFALRIAPAALFAAIYAAIATKAASRQDHGASAPATRNPFDFWPAVGFALLVAVIVVAAHWVIDRYGALGAHFVIGFTGLYDVDAAIIAAASLPSTVRGAGAMGLLLALPVLANNGVKLVLVLGLGGLRAGLAAAWPLIGVSTLIALSIFIAS